MNEMMNEVGAVTYSPKLSKWRTLKNSYKPGLLAIEYLKE